MNAEAALVELMKADARIWQRRQSAQPGPMAGRTAKRGYKGVSKADRQERLDRIKVMHAQGITNREIAVYFNLSPTYIGHITQGHN